MPLICLPPRTLALSISLLLTAPSFAQSTLDTPIRNTHPDAGSKSAHVLEQVKVSATESSRFAAKTANVGPYQGMDMLQIPATINVVNSNVIEAQGVTDLYGALKNVAGVNMQQTNGLAYSNITIRGMNLDQRSSYYFNGVLPFDNNIAIPMEDKESIEVLKGASALYYGFAVPAGIVNMTTKRAGRIPVTTVGMTTDSNGSVKGHIDVGRRFGRHGQFGARLNASSQRWHTPIKQVRGERRMLSLALDWEAASWLSFKVDYEHVDQKLPEQAGITPLAANDGHVSLPRLPNPSRLLTVADDPSRARADTYLLRSDFSLGGGWSGMLSIGQSTTRRERRLSILRRYDLDTGLGQIQLSRQSGQLYRNRNIRTEIYGIIDTGPVTHNLTIGYTRNQLFQPDFTTFYFVAPQNLYAPHMLTSSMLKSSGTPKLFYASTVWTGGLYAMDRMTLGEHWELTLGVRRATYHSSQFGTDNDDVQKTTPSGSLVYKINNSSSVYASYIEGLESAGTAPDTAENAGQVMPAAISKQREVGFRQRLNNGTLWSVAYFDISRASASAGADNVYAINGMDRFRGIEASAQGNLTPQLAWMASAMWLRARNVRGFTPGLVGKTPENTPDKTASLFAEYSFDAVPGLAINGGAYYLARRPINDLNQAWIGGYTLFSAGIRYGMLLKGHSLSLQLNGENLGNKRYWSAAGSNQLAVGVGRTAMFNIEYSL
ncbi:TonB-dependent siderophore receptor [Frateuria aurantia]|uniref:TonB-dependent siderophore receptor n=1 Tax=Frateuria aurantia (strain ATCC 33424 / DSM 6220 / KCTC 2777 / LMG 1558 / NBRC 3245 / NCIMB 13370) TaxID=767434 RepID=H8KYE4_FRAAD|nr:TonB-dependent siderophore receptor [Frateuria aurantia]AFC86948.1 TonB-dependent siderophore receptor [Frateuria aurantia DSM 6220]